MRSALLASTIFVTASLTLFACDAAPSANRDARRGGAATTESDQHASQAPPPPTPQADPFATVPRVSVEELSQALREGRAVVLDVRPEEAFEAERIRGALSMPEEEVKERAGELPPGKLVVTYCA
jgi:hypothetical protein